MQRESSGRDRTSFRFTLAAKRAAISPAAIFVKGGRDRGQPEGAQGARSALLRNIKGGWTHRDTSSWETARGVPALCNANEEA